MTAEEQYTKAEDKSEIIEAMIEFAKYHVLENTKSILLNAKTKTMTGENWHGDNDDDWYYEVIDEDSIINAYSIENIK
jgi:hypothetical protein